MISELKQEFLLLSTQLRGAKRYLLQDRCKNKEAQQKNINEIEARLNEARDKWFVERLSIARQNDVKEAEKLIIHTKPKKAIAIFRKRLGALVDFGDFKSAGMSDYEIAYRKQRQQDKKELFNWAIDEILKANPHIYDKAYLLMLRSADKEKAKIDAKEARIKEAKDTIRKCVIKMINIKYKKKVAQINRERNEGRYGDNKKEALLAKSIQDRDEALLALETDLQGMNYDRLLKRKNDCIRVVKMRNMRHNLGDGVKSSLGIKPYDHYGDIQDFEIRKLRCEIRKSGRYALMLEWVKYKKICENPQKQRRKIGELIVRAKKESYVG